MALVRFGKIPLHEFNLSAKFRWNFTKKKHKLRFSVSAFLDSV